MDPVKQDFVFREVFRQSVGSSVHFLQEERESQPEVRRESVETRHVERATEPEAEKKSERVREPEPTPKPEPKTETVSERETLPKAEDLKPEPELTKIEAPPEEFKSEPKIVVEEKVIESKPSEEDEDDIGPDDSVSHFFGGSHTGDATPRFPALPVAPKRYADAGTVMYSAAPKRVLVKPITLKLENPIQSIKEDSEEKNE
jgi:hypothetical protein